LLCGEELPQALARRHTSAVARERPGPPCSRDLRLAARAWALGTVAERLDGSALTQGRARAPAKGHAAAPPSPPAATGEPRRSSLARVAARREKRKEGPANSPGMATGSRDSVGQSRLRRRRRPGPGKEEDRNEARVWGALPSGGFDPREGRSAIGFDLTAKSDRP